MVTLRRNPVDAPLLGEAVDGSRVAPGIDRAAHEDHGGRRVNVLRLIEQRHRRQDRPPRLAHRHHAGPRSQKAQHADDVVDVAVEIEAAGGERHGAASVQSVI